MLAADDNLETIRDYIRWGASLFQGHGLCYGHGTDNPLDEAVFVVLHALHLPHDLPANYLDGRLTKSEKMEIVSLFRRRVEERVPAAYLTQKAYFAGLEFYVNENVLVPRSPIAELIENGFSPWVVHDGVGRVLDLCAGSGCIGIACAYAFDDASVDLVDVSAAALAVAVENISRHHLEGRVEAINSDLFNGLKGRRYDMIVSNPPYVSEEEMSELSEEFLCEPALGLEAGDDGLEIVSRILRESTDHLEPEGVLVVEVGNSDETLIARYPDVPFMWFEFERGGHGVFMLTYDQLIEYQHHF